MYYEEGFEVSSPLHARKMPGVTVTPRDGINYHCLMQNPNPSVGPYSWGAPGIGPHDPQANANPQVCVWLNF